MTDSSKGPLNLICIATYFKGADFMRECKANGCKVVLITKEKMLGEDWPRDILDDLIAVPNDAGPALFVDLVAFLSKRMSVDKVVALEEFDGVVGALVREHFCLPGLSSSDAKVLRDKLAMAVRSQKGGITVPEFVALINPDEIKAFMET